MNFAKFLRKPFLTEHLQWLLLTAANLLNSMIQVEIMTTIQPKLAQAATRGFLWKTAVLKNVIIFTVKHQQWRLF